MSERVGVDTSGMLADLSRFAARSFGSSQEEIDAILRLVADQLAMRTSFVAHITREAGRNEVVDAFNAPGGCDVEPGLVVSLPDTF